LSLAVKDLRFELGLSSLRGELSFKTEAEFSAFVPGLVSKTTLWVIEASFGFVNVPALGKIGSLKNKKGLTLERPNIYQFLMISKAGVNITYNKPNVKYYRPCTTYFVWVHGKNIKIISSG
jgi:hypothetical protein